MNIAYFLDFPNGYGGAANTVIHYAYLMKQKGHNVTVIIPCTQEGLSHPEFAARCERFELKYHFMYYEVTSQPCYINIITALECREPIRDYLASEKFSLIHSTQLNPAVELAARDLKIPNIMNIYQVDDSAFDIKWLDVFAHYHLSDSELYSNKWKKGLGICSKCIRNGYELTADIKRTYSETDETLKLFFGGRICLWKNQLELIKFAELCISRGIKVHLILCGADNEEYAAKCRKYVCNNGLEAFITFTGFISGIEDYLREADALVCGSVMESFPNVIVEAIANRLPVITTPVAGVPEVIIDGYNGYLSEGFEAENIYRAFLRYLNDRKSGKINMVVENAFNTYQNTSSSAHVTMQLEAYYDYIIRDYSERMKDVCEDEINKELEDINTIFKCLELNFSNSAYLKRHIWYAWNLKSFFQVKKSVYIWGAGKVGGYVKIIIENLFPQFKLIGFIDTFKSGEYLDYPVFRGNDLNMQLDDLIIIANIKGRDSIRQILTEWGKTEHKDFISLV